MAEITLSDFLDFINIYLAPFENLIDDITKANASTQHLLLINFKESTLEKIYSHVWAIGDLTKKIEKDSMVLLQKLLTKSKDMYTQLSEKQE